MEKKEKGLNCQWYIIVPYNDNYSIDIIGNFLGQGYEGANDETIIIYDEEGNLGRAFCVGKKAIDEFGNDIDITDENLHFEIAKRIGNIISN